MVTLAYGELKKRLLVLVPEGLSDDVSLVEKVYRIVKRAPCDVFYLGLVEDADNRLTVMRHLATLSALTASDDVNVKTVLIQSADWIANVQEYYRPGDRVACLAGQVIKTGWMKTAPVREILENTLEAPVIPLDGVYHPWKTASRKWLYGLLFWLGCLVILAGFSLLEIQIDRSMQGFTRTALIFIVLSMEFGAFWAWNHVPKA